MNSIDLMKNPHTVEPVTSFNSEAEWKLEHARREARCNFEWRCFNAWWETYKLMVTKPANPEALLGDVADGVEREYRERRIRVHDDIERIWAGFPKKPRSDRPRPGGGT